MQFSNTSGASSPTDLIPSGFLCWAMVVFRGIKGSQSGGSYGDVELVVADKQPNARRKIWTKIGDPDDNNNTEGYRNMGMVSLTRMIEAAGLVDPKVPASYEQFNGRSCRDILTLLDGKYVAIRVKIEKGKDGHQDKNDVGDFLTPNEQSSSHKNFTKLTMGDHGVSAAPAAAGRTGATSGGFGGGATPAPAPQQLGFQQPQQGQGQSERPLAAAPAATMSPPSNGGGFNPNAAPAFLANHQR